MARIENHKYSIEEAFRECFYIVPDYQREYVWTDKEVHQLLEDIGEQIDAGTTRQYFIGTVLVSPTDQKNHYEVIDGQQRLTQHVEMAFSGLKTPGSLDPFTKLEIEHILPDNPKAELRSTWAAENPNAVYDDYKNRLGNLTLLEKPINIVAGNDFYTAKQVEYGKSGNYLTRSLVALTDVGQNTSISRINAKLAAFPAWNAASIEKRHGLVITLAQEVWKTTAIDV